MSRRRTSPYPGGWVDEGPAASYGWDRPNATFNAMPIGEMTPITTGVSYDWKADATTPARQAFRINREEGRR